MLYKRGVGEAFIYMGLCKILIHIGSNGIVPKSVNQSSTPQIQEYVLDPGLVWTGKRK
jgi:hypothetical protein